MLSGNKSKGGTQVPAFIHETEWTDLPAAVRHQAVRCLLDTVAAAVGGRRTRLSAIIYDFAALAFGGSQCRLWLDGRSVSAPGAALAHGMSIDALDIHDGYTLNKGHIGAAIVPSALAALTLDPKVQEGKELLAALVVGYEVAARAGRALHGTACDYHTSGAWNSLGSAAVVSRRLGSSVEKTRHALGIAEYHGPRSQMMRCIDYPTMLKDGSGWGAMAGVSAALMAHAGFTGAPAVTVESAETAEFWEDLGQNWLINDQYFKPYAVCRWAQPAIAGALALRRQQTLSADDVARVRVSSFFEATKLAVTHPEDTEQAQYSLPFPVAAALVHGQIGPEQLDGSGLADAQVLAVSEKVELIEDESFSARFPAERWARVWIEMRNGAVLDSGEVEASWGAEAPPSDEELLQKFRWLAEPNLPLGRRQRLERAVWEIADSKDAGRQLLDLLCVPILGMDHSG